MPDASDQEGPLLETYTGLARRLGIVPSTLRRWVQMCAIPDQVEVAPGVHRFYMPDVIRAIEAKRRPPEEVEAKKEQACTEPGNEKK